ncbi:MAG: restriction endonuclease [Rhodanobacter sp.]
MAKHKAGRIHQVLVMHWPVGIMLGLIAYAATRYGSGWHMTANHASLLAPGHIHTSTNDHALLAWVLLGTCWFGALLSCMGLRQRMHRLKIQEGLENLCAMNWGDFEKLISEAFRRRGYIVEPSGREETFTGVDLILHKGGRTTLVQCRQWRHQHIDARTVREMHGWMLDHHASAVKIVAVGDYTRDAWNYVSGKPFELIYGESLLNTLYESQPAKAECSLPFATFVANRSQPLPVRRLARP